MTTAIADCMQNIQIPFEQTNQFSSIFLDYIQGKDALKPFYGHFPKLENFALQIEQRKSFPQQHREVLADVLLTQYEGLANKSVATIQKLRDSHTFTVTTGHQLNIFSGPLYFIYKIVSTINLAKELQTQYPDYQFIPIYWMATEDHDFEEISHFRLFGKKYQWATEQNGAVGQMSTAGLEAIMEEIKEMPAFFQSAYATGKNLATATREYVHYLFGDEGLLIVDADDANLKKLFTPVIEADLFSENISEKAIATSQALADADYKTQIYIRGVNLFYLEKGIRTRIEKQGEWFVGVDADLKFSEAEMREMIANSPEKFSPNVVLRPLYQEVILPNLAYLGGPSEVAYWLQLKGIFELFNTPFPILMPRNFALIINKASAKRIDKLNLQVTDLFKDEVTLRKQFVVENAESEVELKAELEQLHKLYNQIVAKAEQVDKSLVGFARSEEQKATKGIENIEKRLKKSEERNQSNAVNQLLKLKETLFPDSTPQERKDNFLNFYLNDPELIQKLLATLKPLDFQMNIVYLD